MTNKGEPAVQPKTAVVLIHGIGEQRPMSTLWGFVDAIWSSDQSLVEPHNSAIYAKPDTINDSFELRRVTTRYWSGDPERRIDFFEFYWAHLMRGNTVHGTIGWMISLFWRRPSTVPKGLLGAWLLGLLFLLLAGALAVLAVVQNVMAVGDYPEWIVYAGAVVSALGSLIASRWFAPIAGDAARYFSPDPDNVEARQKIRLAGIQVIEKLTASKAYDRIIVVGHSLGSAIGLDIISYGFSRVGANQWEVAHPIGSKAANILRELERIAGAISDAEVATIGALRAEYRKAQRRYAAALSEGWDRGAAPWLVTDFVTLGSPLSKAQLLLSADEAEFSLLKDRRQIPTTPPKLESKRPPKFSFPMKSSIHVPHHGAVFAPTVWTNVYFPNLFLVFGDIISGPVSSLFGPGALDVEVPIGGPAFRHTHYWSQPRIEPAPLWIRALRRAVNVRGHDEEVLWGEQSSCSKISVKTLKI